MVFNHAKSGEHMDDVWLIYIVNCADFLFKEVEHFIAFKDVLFLFW